MTGRFDAVSVSAAASTGIMDLRTAQWQPAMLGTIESEEYRQLAARQLPRIVDMNEPIGVLNSESPNADGPLIFPTSDDQQAGLALRIAGAVAKCPRAARGVDARRTARSRRALPGCTRSARLSDRARRARA